MSVAYRLERGGGRLPRRSKTAWLPFRSRELEVGEMVMGRNVVVMSLHRGACFKLLCSCEKEETVDASG